MLLAVFSIHFLCISAFFFMPGQMLTCHLNLRFNFTVHIGINSFFSILLLNDEFDFFNLLRKFLKHAGLSHFSIFLPVFF